MEWYDRRKLADVTQRSLRLPRAAAWLINISIPETGHCHATPVMRSVTAISAARALRQETHLRSHTSQRHDANPSILTA